MTEVPRILLVHESEQSVDISKTKDFLLQEFPDLEGSHNIVTTDIEFLYNMLVVDKLKFDIIIATIHINVFEFEKILRNLRERKIPVVIGKIILPEFKLITINLEKMVFSSNS
jgi:hypothetical protein